MKVLQVIDSGGLYGAEQILLALMEALAGEGIDCSLASIAEPGLPEKALEAEARHRGLDVRRHEMVAGLDRDATRRLLVEARNEGFDLLHTHGYKANTLISGLSRMKRGLPAIATLHGWTATHLWSRVGIYEMVERQALRRADRVVAVSDAMVEKWGLDARYGDQLRVIRNGIPLPKTGSAFHSLPENISSFIAGRRSVLAAGRLSFEKGFDVLIEALAAVRASGLDVALVLAGEGKERNNLEAQVRRLGVVDAVMLPGYLDSAGNLISYFDAVAIPSRTEGLPVILLEALMAGVPVAATGVGETPAVMRSCDAGPCVHPGDVISLAARIASVFRETPQNIHAGESANQARSLYSAKRMAMAYTTLYQELLAQS